MANKIILNLDQPEYTSLLDEADRELRTPSDQARWLLRRALGISEDRQQQQSAKDNQELIPA